MPEYSIVVFGASAFTGDLVVRYLGTKPGLKWAAAGRSQDKVQAVLKAAGVDVPVIVADSKDEESLLKMVKQTKVIVSIVGPYTLYGSLLVKVCAENGVHYVDLCGEAPWIAKNIAAHTQSALASKALLIHSCGFDSIPSDLTAFYAVKTLKEVAGEGVQVGEVFAAATGVGGLSGGTLASGLGALTGGKEDQKVMADPFALSPAPANYKPKSAFFVASSTFQGKRIWGSFFIMGPHNSAIVRRTWGILQSNAPSQSYGAFFRYQEVMKVAGPVSAFIASTVLFSAVAVLVLFAPARWALKKFGPKPGEGPSLEVQEKGYFSMETIARDHDKKFEVKVTLKGKGDPGYSGTAIMISEAALAIAEQFDQLPPLARGGGFLTPASALGEVLIERLEATGKFKFEVEKGDRKTN